MECREALAIPADPHRAVILRRMRRVTGPAQVSVVLDLRAGFGRRADARWPGSGASGPAAAAERRRVRVWFRWSGAAKAPPDGRCG